LFPDVFEKTVLQVMPEIVSREHYYYTLLEPTCQLMFSELL